MNKLIISNVNSQMRYTASIRVKVNQITGFQIGFTDPAANGILLLAGSGKVDAMEPEYVLHITRAVEATGCAASPNIGDTDVLFCGCNDAFRCCHTSFAL